MIDSGKNQGRRLLSLIKRARILGVALLSVPLAACGYSWKAVDTQWLAREQVRRVYVSPVLNNTYKVGVENGVYNQLIRTLRSEGILSLVPRAEEADAVLESAVQRAAYSPSGTTTTTNLFPAGKVPGITGSPNVLVATEFSAILSCQFKLTRRGPSSKVLWAGSVSRSKLFPANNQLGAFGSTSALINESEFERALKDLSALVVSEMHESLRISF